MEKRIDIFNILQAEGKLEKILVYAAQEVENDPYEKSKTNIYMNPLPIKALVQQISTDALRWKFIGQIPTGSIQIIIEKKDKTLIKTADKIEYNDNFYKCYKDDAGSFSILERQDYCVCVLAIKVV